jgi:hypothetical protein
MTLQKIPSVAGSLSVDSDDSKKIRSSIHSIPIAAAFGVIAVLVSLYGLVYAIDSILPTPLSLADEVGRLLHLQENKHTDTLAEIST